MAKGFLVTEEIANAHFRMDNYPLLPGDLLVRQDDGSFLKESPGIAVGGFKLTEAQEAKLDPVDFSSNGLLYKVHKKA